MNVQEAAYSFNYLGTIFSLVTSNLKRLSFLQGRLFSLSLLISH